MIKKYNVINISYVSGLTAQWINSYVKIQRYLTVAEQRHSCFSSATARF